MRCARSLVHSLAAAIALAGVACSDPSDKPLEPVWNKQPCEHCAMILSEPRFAAQLATTDGMHHYFDDIGCLLAWQSEHRSPDAREWVRSGDRWLDAAGARYRTGAHTPMDYGLVPDVNGLSWSEAQAVVARKVAAPEGDDHAR